MKFRYAKKLHKGDEVKVLKTQNVIVVASTEIFLEEKLVRIYSEDGSIYYNNEIE